VAAKWMVAFRAVAVFVVVFMFGAPKCRAALAACTYKGGGQRGKATVIDAGNSVKSDGRGVYAANPGDPWVVEVAAAWNIFPYRTERHLIVDLNKPVPGGGGEPRGVVSSWAGPHSFWKLDTAMNVHGVQEIPVGTTTPSDLTAIFIFSDDGKSAYLLQMGPWSYQTCENYGPVETAGSTQAVIARTSDKNWKVSAPPGSIGILHDVHNPLKPVPLGRYYVNFEINYSLE